MLKCEMAFVRVYCLAQLVGLTCPNLHSCAKDALTLNRLAISCVKVVNCKWFLGRNLWNW